MCHKLPLRADTHACERDREIKREKRKKERQEDPLNKRLFWCFFGECPRECVWARANARTCVCVCVCVCFCGVHAHASMYSMSNMYGLGPCATEEKNQNNSHELWRAREKSALFTFGRPCQKPVGILEELVRNLLVNCDWNAESDVLWEWYIW